MRGPFPVSDAAPRSRSAARDLLDSLWQQPLWAVPFAVFFGTLFGRGWHGYVLSYKMSLVFAYSIRLCLLLVKHVLMPRVSAPEGMRDPRRIGSWIEGILYAGAALLGSYIASFIIHFTLLRGFMGTPRQFLISGMFALIFTLLFCGISYAIVFYQQAVERARAVEQVRAELARAELRALRAQIHPHFLFNTLNTIAALIAENPRAAEETTTRLAEAFRYTLAGSERELARLGDELDFVRGLLEIERTRFGDRLRVEERIAPGLEGAMVPSLLLQPLVENAVRHGAAARSEGGTIRLSASRDGDTLVLEVADDGPGFPAEVSTDRAAAQDGGFGLHSVRERLRAAGPPHALAIHSEPGRGTRVRVTLPWLDVPNDSPRQGDPS